MSSEDNSGGTRQILERAHLVASAPMGELAVVLARGAGLRRASVLAWAASLRRAAALLESAVGVHSGEKL